jgi:ubiquinone/menaquinone biosynthesis C-methylase UbiE
MSYIPALRYESLTRFYDPVLRATLKEDRFKRMLVEQAALRPGHRVLDVGCGTATLTILLKQACVDAEVTGLDGDAKALALARTKIEAAGLDIALKQGLGSEAPFPPASFDRIVSSLVFHHLTTEEKRRTLKRVRELLKSGGEVHIADWGKAQNPAMRVAFLAIQLLDGFSTTTDNVRGLLPTLMTDAGFRAVEETHREMTVFGTLSLYRGLAP